MHLISEWWILWIQRFGVLVSLALLCTQHNHQDTNFTIQTTINYQQTFNNTTSSHQYIPLVLASILRSNANVII
jgi:hypothetical protein